MQPTENLVARAQALGYSDARIAANLAEGSDLSLFESKIAQDEVVASYEPALLQTVGPQVTMYSNFVKGAPYSVPFEEIRSLMVNRQQTHALYMNVESLMQLSEQNGQKHRRWARKRGAVFDMIPQSEFTPYRRSFWLKPHLAALMVEGRPAGRQMLGIRLDTLDAFFDVKHARWDRKEMWDAARDWWASKPPILVTQADADAYRDAERNRYNDAKSEVRAWLVDLGDAGLGDPA